MTFGALVATLLFFLPLVVVAYVRFDSFVALVGLLPPEFVVGGFRFEYVVTLEALLTLTVRSAERAARRAATLAPVLGVKMTLFVFLIYSLLFHAEAAQRATIALVPPEYRGVATALNRRTRETLSAIHVLQAATALGTFMLAVPTFLVLGYDTALTLPAVAAILQFVPVVGASVLLAGLTGYHLAIGELLQAVLVATVGVSLSYSCPTCSPATASPAGRPTSPRASTLSASSGACSPSARSAWSLARWRSDCSWRLQSCSPRN